MKLISNSNRIYHNFKEAKIVVEKSVLTQIVEKVA